MSRPCVSLAFISIPSRMHCDCVFFNFQLWIVNCGFWCMQNDAHMNERRNKKQLTRCIFMTWHWRRCERQPCSRLTYTHSRSAHSSPKVICIGTSTPPSNVCTYSGAMEQCTATIRFRQHRIQRNADDFNCRSAESRWKRTERKKDNGKRLFTLYIFLWLLVLLLAGSKKMRRCGDKCGQLDEIIWWINQFECEAKESETVFRCRSAHGDNDLWTWAKSHTRKLHAIPPIGYSMRFFRSHWSKAEGKTVKNRSAFV